MKRKIIDIIVDVLLIGTVFAVTDIVLLKVFQSENVWLELGVYLVFYAIVFGCKRGVILLWNQYISKKKESN